VRESPLVAFLHRRAAREAVSATVAALLGLPALFVAPYAWGVWFYVGFLGALVWALFLIARKHGAGRPEATPYLVAVGCFVVAGLYFIPRSVTLIGDFWATWDGAPYYLTLILGSFLCYALLLVGLGLRIWQVPRPALKRGVLAAAGLMTVPVAIPLVFMAMGRITLEPLTYNLPYDNAAVIVMLVLWLSFLGNAMLLFLLFNATRSITVAIVGPPGVGKTQILMRLRGDHDRSMESTQVSEDVTVVPRGYNRYMLPIKSRDVPGEDTDAWVSLIATTKVDGLVIVLAPPETEAQRGQWSRFIDQFLDGYRRYSPRQTRLKHILVMVNKQDQWADGQEPMDVIWPFVARLDQLEIAGRKLHVQGSCAYSAGAESVNVVSVINNYIDDHL
jgi:hypothetical protein